MTKDQVYRITKALNSDEVNIPYIPLVEVVLEEIESEGKCSPILDPIKKAWGMDDKTKLDACHRLRSVWRVARWDYQVFSKNWCEWLDK